MNKYNQTKVTAIFEELFDHNIIALPMDFVWLQKYTLSKILSI